MNNIVNRIVARRPFLALILLDCCRTRAVCNNGNQREEEFQLNNINITNGVNCVFAYPCAQGKSSWELGGARNSIWTDCLLQSITERELSVSKVFSKVQQNLNRVASRSNISQQSWINTHLPSGSIYLASKNVTREFYFLISLYTRRRNSIVKLL